jgi:hypothetical protein
VMLAVLTDDGYEKLKGVAPEHVATVRRQFIDHLSRAQLRNVGAALRSVQNGTDILKEGE